jgi:hypothetical protein
MRWIFAMWATLAIETLTIGFIMIRLHEVELENEGRFEINKSLNLELRTVKGELETIKYQLYKSGTTENTGCAPSSTPLKLDEIILINKDYLKSALFMLVGKKDTKALEFNVIMENKTHQVIFPKLDVIFLNSGGGQIGVAHIGNEKDSVSKKEVLDKGEVRSFPGRFELGDNQKPESIIFKINDSDDTK